MTPRIQNARDVILWKRRVRSCNEAPKFASVVLAIALVATLVACPSAPAGSAVNACSIPGKDGSPTYSGGVPNTYYAGSGNLAAGATTIALGSINASGNSTPFTAGDMALVIQMQGATISTTNTVAYGDGSTGAGTTGTPIAGKYEYVAVRAVAGSTLTIVSAGGSGLINSYVNAAATSTQGQQTWQVVRVPQYLRYTVGANLYTARWNGSSGGIVALDVASTLTLSSPINVDGYGFRGGGQNTWGNNYTTAAGNTPPTVATTANSKSGATDVDYVYAPTSATLTYTSGSTYSGGPDGFKGEGIAGTPTLTYASGDAATVLNGTYATDGAGSGYPAGSKGRGAPGNAGGGATDANANGWKESPSDNTWNSGGGGGANGGAGGIGGKNWDGNAGDNGSTAVTTSEGLGGKAFADSATRVVMGGGGGAGSNNDGSVGTRTITVGGGVTFTPTAATASSGGSGGGIVMLRVGSVTSGSISARGIAAPDPVQDGGGGGGAGGTVVLTGTGTISGVSVDVSGGTGASSTGGSGGNGGSFASDLHGTGGGGGGGAILTSGTVTATLTGGAAGTSTTANSAYGATAGSTGVQTSITAASIPGARSGAECAELLMAKRYTALNGATGGYTTYTADGFSDPATGQITDTNPLWPQSGGSPAIFGTMSVLSKPADTMEYTIYLLSAGGKAVSGGAMCDFVPPDQTLVTTAYNAGASAMQVITGYATPATTYFGNAASSGASGVYPINTATGAGSLYALPAACGTAPKSTVTAKYSSAAIYYAPGAIQPFFASDTGYIKISFTAKTF